MILHSFKYLFVLPRGCARLLSFFRGWSWRQMPHETRDTRSGALVKSLWLLSIVSSRGNNLHQQAPRARMLRLLQAVRVIAIKVAIATFGERVSPRFDCAQTFLIVTVDDGRFSERQLVVASDWSTLERPGRLIALGVDAVVCGGIDRWSAKSLQSAGVTVYRGISGETEDALRTLLRGELHSEMEEIAIGNHQRRAWRHEGRYDRERHTIGGTASSWRDRP